MMSTTRSYLVYWEDARGILHPQLCQNCADPKQARRLAMQEYMSHESGTRIKIVIDAETVEKV